MHGSHALSLSPRAKAQLPSPDPILSASASHSLCDMTAPCGALAASRPFGFDPNGHLRLSSLRHPPTYRGGRAQPDVQHSLSYPFSSCLHVALSPTSTWHSLLPPLIRKCLHAISCRVMLSLASNTLTTRVVRVSLPFLASSCGPRHGGAALLLMDVAQSELCACKESCRGVYRGLNFGRTRSGINAALNKQKILYFLVLYRVQL